MKPLIHAQLHAKRFGGKPEDYLELDDWIDQTKSHFPDMRHRAMLHNSWGIFMGEEWFGHTITNSDGKEVSVRDILEHHVIQDMGYIPTIQDYLTGMPFYDWLGGRKKEKQKITISEQNSNCSLDELKKKLMELNMVD